MFHRVVAIVTLLGGLSVALIAADTEPADSSVKSAPAGQELVQRRDLMQQRMQVCRELSQLRQRSLNDPALQQLREEATKAQKAYEAEVEASLAKQPEYTALIAKLDGFNQQLGIPSNSSAMTRDSKAFLGQKHHEHAKVQQSQQAPETPPVTKP